MNYDTPIKYTVKKKVNYLSNKELLKGIAQSKLSYCDFLDAKYKQYDLILASLGEITPAIIKQAKEIRADYLNEKQVEQLINTGLSVKEAIEQVTAKSKITAKNLTRADICFRVMSFEHIPEEITSNPKLIFAKLHFLPFKHYSFLGNKWTEVGRSHWTGDFKTGKFTPEKGKLSNALVKSIMLLVNHYSQKGNFRNYTYLDDMRGQALLQMSQVALQFSENRSENPNPFAFYTQCIKTSFLKILKSEKKVRTMRDDLLISEGVSASFTYQQENQDM